MMSFFGWRAFTESAARLSAALARLLEGVELLGEALEHRRLRHLLDEHLVRVRVRVRFRVGFRVRVRVSVGFRV